MVISEFMALYKLALSIFLAEVKSGPRRFKVKASLEGDDLDVRISKSNKDLDFNNSSIAAPRNPVDPNKMRLFVFGTCLAPP
jgi:hypothetical protein